MTLRFFKKPVSGITVVSYADRILQVIIFWIFAGCWCLRSWRFLLLLSVNIRAGRHWPDLTNRHIICVDGKHTSYCTPNTTLRKTLRIRKRGFQPQQDTTWCSEYVEIISLSHIQMRSWTVNKICCILMDTLLHTALIYLVFSLCIIVYFFVSFVFTRTFAYTF